GDALSRIGPGESSASRPSYWCQFRVVGGSRRPMSSSSTAAAELFQKSDEIVGHVIDVRRVAAFELPAFAKHLAGMFGHHQHGGHAEGLRHREVAGQVLPPSCVCGGVTV